MKRLGCGAVLWLAATFSSTATGVTLYDPALGTLPAAQGWNTLAIGSFTQTAGSLLAFDTTAARTTSAGYFSETPFNGAGEHPLLPTLDRDLGFTLSFDLQVVFEAHNARDDNDDGKEDRAGFSVIIITEDLFGLEIGFFEDRVWVYEDGQDDPLDLFTQAEFALFDTTADVVSYDLLVTGNDYTLLQNDLVLLAGELRNYNPSGVNAFIDPYDNPSFLFFGDDTTSAESHVLLGNISVGALPDTAVAVPMPWAMLGVGAVAMGWLGAAQRHPGRIIPN